MKRFILILLILLSTQISFGQGWHLVKETDNTKAYTKDNENSVKSYKIITYINASKDCVYKKIIDFNHYKEAMKDLKEIKIISNKNDIVIAYWIFDMPWPFDNRDLITKTVITKSKDKIIIKTSIYKKHNIPMKENTVRISDYSETYVLESLSHDKTKITLTGRIDAGGGMPGWVQNMFLIDSPLDFLDYVRKQCGK